MVAAALALFLFGCSPIARYPAAGTVAGQLVETTVASAAPWISSRGNPNRPKMKIGSRIMFRTAATVMTLLSSSVLPRARMDASDVHKATSSGATQYQMLM